MALRHRPRLDLYDDGDERRGSRLPLAVAAVALLGLGMWIGRASQTDAAPETAPAAPERSEPENARVEWPGPTDTREGVAVGYARTEAGAVAAAVHYDRALGRAHGQGLTDVLDVIAAGDARDDLRHGPETQLRRVQEGLGLRPEDPDFVAAAAYAGYVVDSYSDTTASVRLWSTGFIVDPRLGAPGIGGGREPAWSTTTVGLKWESDDWRLATFRIAEGPSPADANTGDPRRTGRAMNDFEDLWHVPPLR